MEDVCKDINDKLIRRHPHVFGDVIANSGDEALSSWNSVKEKEKASKNASLEKEYLLKAFDESKELIEVARKRKMDLLYTTDAPISMTCMKVCIISFVISIRWLLKSITI